MSSRDDPERAPASSSAAQQAPPRRKRIGPRVAAVAVGLVVALAACELVARSRFSPPFTAGQALHSGWKGCARFDPELGWSALPGAHVRVHDGELDYTVRINARGWRDVERELQKPAGTTRVAILGDSMAFGWGVEREARFGEQLEALLGPPVEVLNLATPGWSTDQELLALVERGFVHQPDIVLLGLVLNDLVEADTVHTVGLKKPQVQCNADGTWSVTGRPLENPDGIFRLLGQGIDRALRPSSAAFTWLVDRRALAPARPQRVLEPQEPLVLQRLRRHYAQLADPASLVSGRLRSLRRECAQRGVDLLVVVLPHQHDSYLLEPALAIPPEAEREDFQTELSVRLAECGAREGFATASVDQALLDAVRRGEPLHCGDAHFNAAGNRVVAKALAPVVRRMLDDRRARQ